MKIIFGAILLISVGFNAYFIHDYFQAELFKDSMTAVMEGRYDNLPDGTNYLLKRISGEQPQLSQKNYYFISIWNIACGPCIKEMPTLDSIADQIDRKDIGYIYLTENSDVMIRGFLKRKNISSRNFVYINDANDYIMALMRSQGIKGKGYPVQVILDKHGNVLHFGGGYVESVRDTTLRSQMNALPRR